MTSCHNKRSLKGKIIATLLSLAVSVLIAEGALRIAFPTWDEFSSARFMRTIHVPNYGFLRTGIPEFNGYLAQNNGDFRVRVRLNSIGLRNQEDLHNVGKQIWTMGDSMTFGFGVEQHETYTEKLESYLDGVLAYNFAGPGNDVCGYRTMTKLTPVNEQPLAIILGLFLENDVKNYDCDARYIEQKKATGDTSHLSYFSMFDLKRKLTASSAFYNFAAVTLKRIEFFKQLLTMTGIIEKEHAERNHPPPSETTKIVGKTVNEIRKLRSDFDKNIPFAVLIIPARLELRDSDPYYTNLRETLVAQLKQENLEVIDPIVNLKKAGFSIVHFLHDGHWTAGGHAIAAREIYKWVKGYVN